MSEHWFKPKTHGYGATPVHWKGWAAMLAFAAAIGLMVALLFVMAPQDGGAPSLWVVAPLIVGLGWGTTAFLRLCRAKTSGPWRWRWGERSDG